MSMCFTIDCRSGRSSGGGTAFLAETPLCVVPHVCVNTRYCSSLRTLEGISGLHIGNLKGLTSSGPSISVPRPIYTLLAAVAFPQNVQACATNCVRTYLVVHTSPLHCTLVPYLSQSPGNHAHAAQTVVNSSTLPPTP